MKEYTKKQEIFTTYSYDEIIEIMGRVDYGCFKGVDLHHGYHANVGYYKFTLNNHHLNNEYILYKGSLAVFGDQGSFEIINYIELLNKKYDEKI